MYEYKNEGSLYPRIWITHKQPPILIKSNLVQKFENVKERTKMYSAIRIIIHETCEKCFIEAVYM